MAPLARVLVLLSLLCGVAACSADRELQEEPYRQLVEAPVAKRLGAELGSDSGYRVTVLPASGAAELLLHLELYSGHQPTDPLVRLQANTVLQPLTLHLPAGGGPRWWLRIDSRPPSQGIYSVALHLRDSEPQPRFDAAVPDRYESDDSWFQGSLLSPGLAQAHSMGASANPRGDEDWFVLSLDGIR
ncbi:MAG: hypothetical protein CMP23_14795 [Rickettsiales bacterium]|nr:hypothetical protein [Rickettsiales bacterium]|tara:strand:+ start:1380 stop:1940 length:561 start_codon:yes stop_codon:yes gene_type:complete